MSPKAKLFLLQWVNNTVAVFVAASIVKGIHYDSFLGLVTASFLLGILNTFIRPVLRLLSLPLIIFTLGVFFFVINALMLYMVGSLLTSFRVESFMAAFWGALIISFISLVLNSLTGIGNARFLIRRGTPPPRNPDDRDGPVIDV
jgi:putative membrane protein